MCISRGYVLYTPQLRCSTTLAACQHGNTFSSTAYILYTYWPTSALLVLSYYSTGINRTAALAETKRTAQLQTSVLVMVTSRRDASVLNIACYASSLSGSLVFKHTCSLCRIFCRSWCLTVCDKRRASYHFADQFHTSLKRLKI